MNTTGRYRASAPFRCRVLHSHHWVVRSTDDGERYEACRDCGKERPDGGFGGVVISGG